MDIQIFTHLCVIEAYDEYTGAGGGALGHGSDGVLQGRFRELIFSFPCPRQTHKAPPAGEEPKAVITDTNFSGR